MASICLYDIDFYHSSRSTPNLELMKVFNYYYQRGDVIIFGKPTDDFDRFNQVIFFKQSPNVKIPKKLSLTGENKQIYGYGFYKRFIPLKPIYAETPPIFLPYELNMENIKNKKLYNSLKNNSYVRVENNDMSGFKPEASIIYIADENPLYSQGMEDFCKQYKSKYYTIQFIHTPIATDEETFKKFFSIISQNNKRGMINFKFSKSFFEKFYYENVIFRGEPFPEETNFAKYFERIVTMVLWAKSEKRTIDFYISISATEKREQPLFNFWDDLIKWVRNKEQISAYTFLCKEKTQEYVDQILEDYKDIRLLLKQNPLTFSTQDVDFFNNI